MRCELCGREYDAVTAAENCKKNCNKYGKCGLEPCPTCYYETVLEPQWYGNIFAVPST